MLHLFKSNRLNPLLTHLQQVMGQHRRRPFEFDLIAAPDGVQERVKVALAEAEQVFAGKVVSPHAAVEALIARVVPAMSASTSASTSSSLAYHADAMLFSLCRQMTSRLNEPKLAPVRQYLGDSVSMKKMVSLADVLTALFGEYSVYRPRMLRNWKADAPDWQSALMIEACKTFDAHLGERALQALETLGQRAISNTALPSRVVVFGVSALPPLFLELLAAVSVHVEVYLFVVMPSLDYFEGQRSKNEGGTSQQNPLLALLGRQSAAFQEALITVSAQVPTMETDCFADAPGHTALGKIQHHVLHNTPFQCEITPVGLPDVQFHKCTSMAREVDAAVSEILRSIMTYGIAPSEIVVMAPDINAYAPYVDAALVNTGVPYAIFDRTLTVATGAPEVTEALLMLLDTRLELQAVFALLQMAPVRQMFSLDAESVATASEWCRHVRIRSCMDTDHRKRLGLLPFHENTWQFGLERLMLGIAIDDEDELFAGVAPVSAYAGSDAHILGRVVQFVEELFELARDCEAAHPVPKWCALLESGLCRLMDAATDGLSTVKSVLQQLTSHSEAVGWDSPIDFAAFRVILKSRIARKVFASGHSSGVRFSSFRFLRGDGVKMVVLLGMDDKRFPKESRAPSFDMIAKEPRAGDKDPRSDGYHMFLEAVMSASERLVLVYGGSASESGGAVKPCGPVRELEKAVASMSSAKGALEGLWQVVHPSTSHDAVYFQDSEPAYVNFRRNDFQAALAVRRRPATGAGVPAFAGMTTSESFGNGSESEREKQLSSLLSNNADSEITLALYDFFRFWKNPVLFYLEQSLGLAFAAPREAVSDDEPLTLEKLDEWQVGRLFIDSLIRGQSWSHVWPHARALGIAPFGSLGEFFARRVYSRAAGIADMVEKRQVLEKRQNTALDVRLPTRLGTLRLLGTLPLVDGAVVDYSYSQVKSTTLLGLLLKYLAVQSALGNNAPIAAELFGRKSDDVIQCRIEMDVAQTQPIMRQLAVHTLEGLQRPLPFVPDESFTYIQRLEKIPEPKKRQYLMNTLAALKQQMKMRAPAEARGLLDMGLLDTRPLDFHSVAEDVVSPVLRHVETRKLK
ncbi:MAG: exodeoxyribonuclease V subunit gamma [Deltaproteobacteria bacterium]|nr:exodeoxyribonuclease V subunit gamma [Deltaproteobacteria bacterium]